MEYADVLVLWSFKITDVRYVPVVFYCNCSTFQIKWETAFLPNFARKIKSEPHSLSYIEYICRQMKLVEKTGLSMRLHRVSVGLLMRVTL